MCMWSVLGLFRTCARVFGTRVRACVQVYVQVYAQPCVCASARVRAHVPVCVLVHILSTCVHTSAALTSP